MTKNMKKILLLITAPLLLVDACSSAMLAKKERAVKTNIPVAHKPIAAAVKVISIDPPKTSVVRELSNGQFDHTSAETNNRPKYFRPKF